MHSRAILYSTFSSEAIKQSVLSHYDLDDTMECTLFSRGLNDTYLVEAGANFLSDGYFSYLVTFGEQIESEHLNQ